jgi:hypothetical protein
MNTIAIDCSEIKDWESFHQCFKKTFGFPDFYGKNMDAWIDCMTRLDEEFSEFQIKEGDFVTLSLLNITSFKKNCPDIYEDLIKCSAFVNYRRIEIGISPILLLSFYD